MYREATLRASARRSNKFGLQQRKKTRMRAVRARCRQAFLRRSQAFRRGREFPPRRASGGSESAKVSTNIFCPTRRLPPRAVGRSARIYNANAAVGHKLVDGGTVAQAVLEEVFEPRNLVPFARVAAQIYFGKRMPRSPRMRAARRRKQRGERTEYPSCLFHKNALSCRFLKLGI